MTQAVNLATLGSKLDSTATLLSSSLTIGSSNFSGTAVEKKFNVREDGTDSSFKGILLNNAGGSGSVIGAYFQCYDWVQGGIWHGRGVTGTERDGAVILGTNPNTSDLTAAGLVGRLVINNAGFVRLPAQPAFSAYMGTAQSIPSSSQTKLNIDTVEFNTGSYFNTSTKRFVAPVAGRYIFTVSVQHQNNNQCHSAFFVNNSLLNDGWLDFGTGTASSQTRIFNLAANDYVDVWTYATTATTASGTRCKFTGFFLG